MDSLLPKPENSLLKPENKVPAYLNDRGLRMVLIPLFAIAVPNLTGLVSYHFNWWTLIFHYFYRYLCRRLLIIILKFMGGGRP